MEALNQTRPLAKPKERRGLNLAMQAFLDEELPRIEAARSTKVEARVVLHLTPPEEAIDESLKQVWVGVRVWVRGRVRVGLANPNPYP